VKARKAERGNKIRNKERKKGAGKQPKIEVNACMSASTFKRTSNKL